jgi:hypothetical protein
MAVPVLIGCGADGPATKVELCSSFDAVSKELYRGVFNDNGVFRKAGDLAGVAERYQDSTRVQASAPEIQKIADSKSTSLNALRNATIAIADVCGHPLGLNL